LNKESLRKKFTDISDKIQNEFERNIQKYGDKIQCRKGCSQCCSQIFRITQTDAAIMKIHLNELPRKTKEILKKKSEKYNLKIKNNNISPDEYITEPKIPCPALDDTGACMIYEARPIICRRFGPPVYDYKNPEKLFACELNFRNGEEIIDDDLIPVQTRIGKAWDELKTEFNKENKLKENASTTIAEAILDSLDL
jgi:Fe-S-cluster containining protein